MGIFIYSFKLLERGMRVNLRGGDAFMPQQQFYALYTCAVIEHRSGKSMPKNMRGQLLQSAKPRKFFFTSLRTWNGFMRRPSFVKNNASSNAFTSLFLTEM